MSTAVNDLVTQRPGHPFDPIAPEPESINDRVHEHLPTDRHPRRSTSDAIMTADNVGEMPWFATDTFRVRPISPANAEFWSGPPDDRVATLLIPAWLRFSAPSMTWGMLPAGSFMYAKAHEEELEWRSWTLLDPIGTLVAGATIDALVGHSGGMPPIAENRARETWFRSQDFHEFVLETRGSSYSCQLRAGHHWCYRHPPERRGLLRHTIRHEASDVRCDDGPLLLASFKHTHAGANGYPAPACRTHWAWAIEHGLSSGPVIGQRDADGDWHFVPPER